MDDVISQSARPSQLNFLMILNLNIRLGAFKNQIEGCVTVEISEIPTYRVAKLKKNRLLNLKSYNKGSVS